MFRLYKEDFQSDEKGNTMIKIYYKTNDLSVSCKLVEQKLGHILTKMQSTKPKAKEGKSWRSKRESILKVNG